MSRNTSAIDRAGDIKLAAFDVDGVFTNGDLTFSSKLGEIKTFHAHDGLGLKLLKASGCEIAIISSRSSEITAERFSELGLVEVHQNQKDKAEMLSKLMNKYGLQRSNVAYTGDDLVDMPAMKLSGLAIAVANAHELVKQQADWVTSKNGGQGAVREICDMILMAQGNLESVIKDYAG